MATVTFEDERTKLVVTVRNASYRDDINRIEMQDRAKDTLSEDPHVILAAMFTYPRLVCCTPTGSITLDGETIEWPPSLEIVMDLSATAVNAWYNEAARLNPDWFPSVEEIEKKIKETSLSTESSKSSNRKRRKASPTLTR